MKKGTRRKSKDKDPYAYTGTVLIQKTPEIWERKKESMMNSYYDAISERHQVLAFAQEALKRAEATLAEAERCMKEANEKIGKLQSVVSANDLIEFMDKFKE